MLGISHQSARAVAIPGFLVMVYSQKRNVFCDAIYSILLFGKMGAEFGVVLEKFTSRGT